MSNRICPICKLNFNNLWKHFWNDHKGLNLTESEFLCKYLNLIEVPKCINCNKSVSIDYWSYKFNKTCSKSCSSSIKYHKHNNLSINTVKDYICKNCNNTFHNRQSYVSHGCFKNINNFVKWKLNQSKETLSEISKKSQLTQELNGSFDKRIAGLRKYNESLSPKQKHNLAVKRGLASVKARKFDGKNYYVSKVEINLYNRLKHLFPNYTIYGYESDFQVSIYKPDIYIKELNLIIEVDGYKFHDIEKDIKRDKFIANELGCRIKRLDADYVKNYMSDQELLCNILIEMSQTSNYYDRIPIDDINHWKWYPYITGPRLLLTYNKVHSD